MSVTYDDIKKALSDLSPKEKAQLALDLDVSERTIYRWADGTTTMTKVIALALDTRLGKKGKASGR